MGRRHDILPERLNGEPAIFKGCSSSELGMILLASVAVWLPVSISVAAALGAVTMGFGLAGIGIVASVSGLATLFQRLKRNRPDGYYQQRFVLWCQAHRLRPARIVTRSGHWDIGRTDRGPV